MRLDFDGRCSYLKETPKQKPCAAVAGYGFLLTYIEETFVSRKPLYRRLKGFFEEKIRPDG